MELIELKNLSFQGANSRTSLLDVMYPKEGKNLGILFFLHGFKGFKDWGCFPLFTKALASANYCVIAFNFSHNGGTAENPIDFPDLDAFAKNTYSKEVEDIGAVYNWLNNTTQLDKSRLNVNKVTLIGHSRGGSMALLAAAKYSWVGKVATLAAVANLEKRLFAFEGMEEWERSGIRYIENARTQQKMPMQFTFVDDLLQNSQSLNVQKAVEQLSIPQLILHGAADETVPISDFEALKAWNPKANSALIPDAGHTFGGKHPWEDDTLPLAMQEAVKLIADFLKPK